MERHRAAVDEFELAPQLDEQSDKLPYGLQKMLGCFCICGSAEGVAAR